MGTADNAWGGGYGAREFGPSDWANARWRRKGGTRWTGFEIVALVLGFIVFWPIGLAILGYKYWQGRSGGPDLQTFATDKMAGCAHHDVFEFFLELRRRHAAREPLLCRPRPATWPSTSGATAELARLDEERRKLDDAQREFSEYVEAIRRAKDREEFDRFMAERRARPANGGAASRADRRPVSTASQI